MNAEDQQKEAYGRLTHPITTIQRLTESFENPETNERRAVLQIGYNLGRLSELTEAGRALWDEWKEPIQSGDGPTLRRLAAELPRRLRSGDAQP